MDLYENTKQINSMDIGNSALTFNTSSGDKYATGNNALDANTMRSSN